MQQNEILSKNSRNKCEGFIYAWKFSAPMQCGAQLMQF